MDRDRRLQELIRLDRIDRDAYSGDLDLPPWALSEDVYAEPDADILVAKITLASTVRWLGIGKLWDSGALKKAWDALFDACSQRNLDQCRYWQKEVSRRRSDCFGEEGPPGIGVPRRPVPPRRSSGNSL